MKLRDDQPPKNARRIYRWDDLPRCLRKGLYLVENEGQEPREIYVGNKRQRVLEGLMRSPLYAASYARLSDHVDHLKREGVDIATEMFRNDPETGRETFGVYFLRSKVTLLTSAAREVAA